MEDAMAVGATSAAAREQSGMKASPAPLAFATQGQNVRVVNVRSNNDELHHHLENLGFVEGADVRVVADQGGNLIVEVKGARVAINRATANKIIVS